MDGKQNTGINGHFSNRGKPLLHIRIHITQYLLKIRIPSIHSLLKLESSAKKKKKRQKDLTVVTKSLIKWQLKFKIAKKQSKAHGKKIAFTMQA